MDERTRVDTGWGAVHNEYVELNAGFAHDPGTSAYEQIRNVCHSRDLAMGRLNAIYVSIDCKPNIMDAQAKGKYRDKKGKPLPGPDGDLARACDDQLLDVLRAVKRIVEERTLLSDQRDRELEHELEAAYDASTDDEAERHADVELDRRMSDDGTDEPDDWTASAGHTAESEVTGHHGTEPDPQRITPASAVSGESTSPMLETAVTSLSPLACTDGASGGQTADDAPALAESASGGGNCSSGEQQGTVLSFGHDPILICLTQGCNRRRRVVCDNGYASPRHLASHCFLDCPY